MVGHMQWEFEGKMRKGVEMGITTDLCQFCHCWKEMPSGLVCLLMFQGAIITFFQQGTKLQLVTYSFHVCINHDSFLKTLGQPWCVQTTHTAIW